MTEIGVVATSAYLPSTRSLHSHLLRPVPEPQGRTAQLLQACFEDNLRMHGVEMPQMLAALQRHGDTLGLAQRLGRETLAEESAMEISEMVVHAVRALLVPPAGGSWGPVSTFMVCQTSLEQDVTVSAACRLQAEFKQGRVPFSIGQQQGVSFLLAMSVASDLMLSSDDDSVVIAAAEKWAWPYLRTVSTTALLGDGAGAILLQRGCQRGWMLRSLQVCTPPSTSDVYGHILRDAPLTLETDALCDLVLDTLRAGQCRPAEVDLLVPHELTLGLTELVRERCGLGMAWPGSTRADAAGYLCAAEVPVRLHQVLQQRPAQRGQHLLAWALGFNGSRACALFEYVDAGVPHEAS